MVSSRVLSETNSSNRRIASYNSPVTPQATSEDRWALAVAACALLLAGLFAYALFVPPAANSRGLPHPELSTLLQGGSGVERHGSLLWLGWAVGVVEILLFVALVALGARRERSARTTADGAGGLRGLAWPLAAGLAAYLATWTFLMVVYARGLGGPAPDLFLALPPATAVMLYLVWPLPLVFAAFYVVGFRRWVFSGQDEADFQALVARRRARATPEDDAD